MASAASAFSGFVRWSYAFPTGSAQVVTQPAYRPRHFSPGQYATLELLVDLILPPVSIAGQTQQPGAKETGLAEFIDFMVLSDRALQQPFQDGLAWLDQAAGTGGFVGLPAPAQHALLERLAYRAKQRAGEAEGQKFFQLVRKYTVMGFYTTRVGLESLDFPGLKFYSTSPGCTHPGNPEHVGL